MTSLLWSIQIPTWLATAWRRLVARGPRNAKPSTESRSIIVFRLDQLGDVILTTPVFRELKRLYPRARCTVIVRPEYKAILTTNRNVDEILSPQRMRARWLPARARWLASVWWFYWTELRHRHFDLAISPRWDVDENLATLLCVLTPASIRAGHSARVSAQKHRLNRGFDATFDIVVPPGPLRHEVDRNLAIVEALGAKAMSSHLDIRLTGNDSRFAHELFTHHDPRRALVAIGIGGRAASRRWPLDRYAEVIARLNRDRLVQPVIVCSGEEDAEASELSRKLAVAPYILSEVPLRAVCAVLERCDLFLGNDTGTAHLAAAMECPTVVISRHPANGDPNHANSPARFGPRCAHSRVLQPLSGADDCVRSCHSQDPHCIKLVTVDQVIAAVLDLLGQGSVERRELRPAAVAASCATPGLDAVTQPSGALVIS